jgi:D-alanyl-lipoteichoic acid acyltransferase DltB (MBOAT superfamily)
MAAAWLVAISLAFYAWDLPSRLPLIIVSMTFNYVIGCILMTRKSNWLLMVGVGGDLLALGYFKYMDFILGLILPIFGYGYTPKNITLPVGISFFTFTQIAFLIDAWNNSVKDYHPLRYALFVTYFPHLVAGPILHHKDIMPQFALPETYHPKLRNIAIGLTWFGMGLFKKTMLADGIAGNATPVFDAAAHGIVPGCADAWIAALSYTLQIYFDFSGYSDMACGLAMMMGVTIPLNFHSPYKATSLIEFWRRWHMSLSRFLKDYLYIPLGGSRNGRWLRYRNLMVTMLLGGLWHGAALNFLLWGFIHGLGLLINHAWRTITGSRRLIPCPIGWGLTLFAVVIAWIPFRAEGLPATLRMWQGLAGLGEGGTALLPLSSSVIASIIGLSVLAVAAPNTQQLLLSPPESRLTWTPNLLWATFAGLVFGLGLAAITFRADSEFLYFRF